ncbi:hypothetical protein J2X07_000714 [Fictibacillus barbaricus]|uniref:TMhelix containing protein n=1 Tax=Fictibacillus barbaricus TaxID=182136 RepID=A0ABU1TX33_9BACL|nr:hypothetical protein [Fictibacillus barbaricus]
MLDIYMALTLAASFVIFTGFIKWCDTVVGSGEEK